MFNITKSTVRKCSTLTMSPKQTHVPENPPKIPQNISATRPVTTKVSANKISVTMLLSFKNAAVASNYTPTFVSSKISLTVYADYCLRSDTTSHALIKL